jgi:hypothetical protein
MIAEDVIQGVAEGFGFLDGGIDFDSGHII